jgi:hypothetical protein
LGESGRFDVGVRVSLDGGVAAIGSVWTRVTVWIVSGELLEYLCSWLTHPLVPEATPTTTRRRKYDRIFSMPHAKMDFADFPLGHSPQAGI